MSHIATTLTAITHRSIAHYQALIQATANHAEEIESIAESRPCQTERQNLLATAAKIRAQLPALITRLHELQARLEPPPTARDYEGTFDLADEALPGEAASVWGAICETTARAA